MSNAQLQRLLRSLDGSAPELNTNNSKRLNDYVRMAQQMYVQANAYFADQRYEEACVCAAAGGPHPRAAKQQLKRGLSLPGAAWASYVFYLRLVKLRIRTMERHNAASMPQYRREMSRTKEVCACSAPEAGWRRN